MIKELTKRKHLQDASCTKIVPIIINDHSYECVLVKEEQSILKYLQDFLDHNLHGNRSSYMAARCFERFLYAKIHELDCRYEFITIASVYDDTTPIAWQIEVYDKTFHESEIWKFTRERYRRNGLQRKMTNIIEGVE